MGPQQPVAFNHAGQWIKSLRHIKQRNFVTTKTLSKYTSHVIMKLEEMRDFQKIFIKML